ncbi:DNA repair protein RadA/Sms [Motilibacter rhizosphaerae]|uniref:DNA repair protein RadA n=1 Tax=Motilibacter rhizosphaerae TaxID=598652 RepID=A0A4Q7NAT4_9ACTN|nr:DNA repair protein RadA [Motilibacter rhizosphaerae]RZS79472.1 DNA repair protein RadA/Sms [Motilibacter rhizosphaerae]
MAAVRGSSRTAKGRERAAYRCAECGWTTAKWVGRCGECSAWGTLEEPGPVVGQTRAGAVTAPARPIGEVDLQQASARPTGVGELDRVLGGGLVPGAVVLLAGEPGVGKSTLLLEVAARCARPGAPTLYVTGEESAGQVRLRAERVGAVSPELYLAAEQDLGALLSHVDAVSPGLLVVDSVQTFASADVDGVAGGVTQVREVAATVTRTAKERGIATVLVGHVTKDGGIAGPRQLEHLVDVVLQVEGDRASRLRLVRAVKNRYGPTDEVGCFELADAGIFEVADPSGLFVTRHLTPVAGTCTAVTLEGRRPLLAEVQALVAPSASPQPRRATNGLDSARTAMVLAVLERRAGVRLRDRDVFLATVGGVRLAEPASDLAVALAVLSAQHELPLPPGLVAAGELGLAGEVRACLGVERRLAEAKRLGFRQAVVPPGSYEVPPGMTVVRAADIASAVEAAVRLQRTTPQPRPPERG